MAEMLSMSSADLAEREVDVPFLFTAIWDGNIFNGIWKVFFLGFGIGLISLLGFGIGSIYYNNPVDQQVNTVALSSAELYKMITLFVKSMSILCKNMSARR